MTDDIEQSVQGRMSTMSDRTLRFGRTLFGATVSLVLLSGAAVAMPAAAAPARQSTPHYVQIAGLFGESDEEKAARLAAEQREQAQDASITSLTQRVSDLEHALRQLTGQLEDANHQNMLLQQKIDRMQKDFDYKLCQVSARQLGASTDGSDASNDSGLPTIDCSALGQSSAQPALTVPGGGGQHGGFSAPPQTGATNGADQMGQSPGVLGTLPAGTAVPQPSAGGNSAVNSSATTTGGGARQQFDSAMNLLAKAQYDEARGAFRSFADTYPKDALAPQAVYWIGSIAYVQKDFPGAARAFAEEIKEYPDSPRGPESMLKLGQSLLAMNQKDEGCTTLGALRSKYRHASKTIQREAEKARHDARCH